jgi:hypothetical protein
MATILSDEQLLKKIKGTAASSLVTEGLIYESQLKVYTEALNYEELRNEVGFKDILQTMRGRLHKDKYDSTLKYFTFPLPIVNETRDISGDLNRVFYARNANFKNTYGNKQVEAAAEELFKEMGISNYIHETGKEVLKNKPNTFVVLDKDLKGRTYIVTVYNESIIEAPFIDGSKTELQYIQFKHSEYLDDSGKAVQRIAHYDSESYRVIDVINGANVITINNAHSLGSCPARPFLKDCRNNKNPFDRYSPFAPVLAILTNWTLFDAYLMYLEHYAVYPVVEKSKEACDDDNCENGKTRDELADGGYTDWKACESCSSSKMIGPGTVVEIDPAMYKDEQDVSGMLRFATPDIKNAEYATARQQARLDYLKRNTTGITQVMENEAVNPDQVKSVMESARKPLLLIASMLNDIDVWIHESSAKLSLAAEMQRYANWGTEWLLMSESDIQKLFLTAKETGMPESELDELYTQLIETKYKSNPSKIRSLVIQNNLNPSPYSKLEECYIKVEKGVMSRLDLDIKANITKYIKRFERDNGSLSEYGVLAVTQENKTFSKIIEEIYNILLTYAKENEKSTERTDDESEQVGSEGR